MIKPTIGRIVWFHYNKHDDRNHPLAAIVTHVHSDIMVNLCVLDPNGVPFPKTSVHLEQGEGETHVGMYCRWMPYQKLQTEKVQQLAAMAAGGQ